MKHITPAIVVIFFIIACSDEEIDVFIDEPTIEVQFFNIDSLVKTEDSLKLINDSILFLADSISIWGDSITTLSDSIASLTLLIDAGQTNFETEKKILESYLSTLTISLVNYVKLDSIMDAGNSKFTDVKSDIESGKMVLSTLTNVDNGNQLMYEDSATTYLIPLSMTENVSSYTIEIDEILYDLEFEYSRTNEVDEKSRVIVKAFDIAVKRHTFDSLNVICNTSLCENEGLSLQVYF